MRPNLATSFNGNDKATKLGVHARTGVFNKRSILLILYAIYIAFILVSTIPNLAQQHTRYDLVDGDHTYHLVFENDGSVEPHYFDILRADPSDPGVLDLSYDPESHTLNIDAENIKELRIESESIYKDEADIIVGKAYSEDNDYYKQWFIDKNKFTIHIDSDTEITNLVIENVPIPVSVLVNDEEWWKTNLNYDLVDDDVTISQVPQGSTTVVIYFQESTPPVTPHAEFTVSKFVAIVDEDVFFDGTSSYDDDGTIEHYIWDFGDDSEAGSQPVLKHSYSATGTYTVSLTVIDDDNLDDTQSKDIYIVTQNEDDDSDGVPNHLDPHPFNAMDSDSDGLSDDFEDFYDGDAFSSDPWPGGGDLDKMKKDTDGDGYDDSVEIDQGTKPLDPTDYPKEGDGEPKDDDGILGMGATGDILLIVIIIIIILVVLMIILKKRKGGAEVEPEDEDEGLVDKRDVGPGLVKPGARELGPGPAVGAPGARAKKRAGVQPSRKAPLRPSPPTGKLQQVDRMKPPIKKLSTKPPIQPSVMLDTLEVDSLKKFLPPEKLKLKQPISDPDKPGMTKIKRPSPKPPMDTKLRTKTAAPRPEMESLVKPKPPTSLKDQSPADYKAETIAKFAQALGIGRAKATALYNGGFTSISQLQKASPQQLMEIKGIGPKMAERIIKNLEFLMAKRM
jgi:PKD repeat protein